MVLAGGEERPPTEGEEGVMQELCTEEEDVETDSKVCGQLGELAAWPYRVRMIGEASSGKEKK